MTSLPTSDSPFFDRSKSSTNPLWQYVRQLDPDVASCLSQPSPEAVQMMESNLVGILGGLPSDQFGVTISTSRENLGRLLASAMVSGYFLHSAEQRMAFDRQLASQFDDTSVDS